MLGVLLADAVCAGLDPDVGTRTLLVPVPSHRRSRRGFDAVGGIVRHTVPALRARGWRIEVARPVRGVGAYLPLKELGRDERRRAVAGAFAIDPRIAARAAAARCPVIVVDDVVTTGATVDRIATMLASAGCPVTGVASVALVSPGTPAPSRAPARPTLQR
jgi:predicted amidophosphoribosyltransferase